MAIEPGMRSGTLDFRLLIEAGKQAMLIGVIRGFIHELRPGAERSYSPFRERLDRATAASLAGLVVPRAIATGIPVDLVLMHRAAVGREPTWQGRNQAADWLRRALANGQVALFRRVPPMGAMGHGEYATMLGIDRGTVDPQIASSEPINTVQASYWDPATKTMVLLPSVAVSAFAGGGDGKALENITSDTCPADNWRSESTDTCDPSVHAWFKSHHVETGFQNSTLGRKGGGGFLATTTRVKSLPKGTVLYRYVNSPTEPYGGWWFEKPLTGDPRVYAALPDCQYGKGHGESPHQGGDHGSLWTRRPAMQQQAGRAGTDPDRVGGLPPHPTQHVGNHMRMIHG